MVDSSREIVVEMHQDVDKDLHSLAQKAWGDPCQCMKMLVRAK